MAGSMDWSVVCGPWLGQLQTAILAAIFETLMLAENTDKVSGVVLLILA